STDDAGEVAFRVVRARVTGAQAVRAYDFPIGCQVPCGNFQVRAGACFVLTIGVQRTELDRADLIAGAPRPAFVRPAEARPDCRRVEVFVTFVCTAEVHRAIRVRGTERPQARLVARHGSRVRGRRRGRGRRSHQPEAAERGRIVVDGVRLT